MELQGKMWREGKEWSVNCPALDLTTTGKNRSDALFNLQDAIYYLLENYEWEGPVDVDVIGYVDHTIAIKCSEPEALQMLMQVVNPKKAIV